MHLSKVVIPTVTACCWESQPHDVFSSKGWNAGTHPNAHIEIDLGEIKSISKISIQVVQQPDGETEHYIKGGENPHPTVVYGHSKGYTRHEDVLTFYIRAEIRFLRIESVVSPSWVAWKNLEIFEKKKK